VYNRLVKNQKNTSKSRLTEKLILLDMHRGRAFMALRDILHGISISLIEEMGYKAANLYAILDKYGTQAYRLNYKAETAMFISLFAEFDLPVNQKLLADLNIAIYYESLIAAQKEFDVVSGQKLQEKAAYANETEAATQILEELFPALINLVAMIQLNCQLEPVKYGTICNQMVTYVTDLSAITDVSAIARSRQTRKQSSDNKMNVVVI